MARGTEEFPLKILLLGPRGNGKSTVAVQILHQWGGLTPEMMQRLQKQMEQKSLTQAQLLESFQKNQGSTPGRHYSSPKYKVSIISSGCRFIPHECQAACLLLVLSAAPEEFGNTWRLIKRQLTFACSLPVQQLVVCVNKMDATLPPYSARRYNTIAHKISVRLQGLQSCPEVVFLPISAMHGENMEGISQQMLWFGGWKIKEKDGGTLQGRTLRQLLDGIFLNHKLDSHCKRGVWSPQEEKSLLQVWKGMATLDNPPCPHRLSLELMSAGVRRSPEQCRSKANSLLNCYIADQLQWGRHPSASPKELQDILAWEAAKAELKREALSLLRPTQASEPRGEEEPPVSVAEEQGPGVCSERLQGDRERREGLPGLPRCPRLPRGQRDQDADYVLTGLEIKPCRRLACLISGPTEPGAAEAAVLEGYRCMVNRLAIFAVNQKQFERTIGAKPWVRPKPLLAVPPLPPRVPQCPPRPPAVQADRLLLFPVPPLAPLQLPLLPGDSPGVAVPAAPALLPLPVRPMLSALADALSWQDKEVLMYAPLQPVEYWPSPHSWGPAPRGEEPPLALPARPAAAASAAATWLTPGPPKPGPRGPPPEDSEDLPSAAVGPESPSEGTSTSPLQHEAPPESSLGLSAAALLSSLGLLESEKDLEVTCPPGTPLWPLSSPLSADSGATPSPQLQGRLSSSRLSSPSCPDPCPGDS